MSKAIRSQYRTVANDNGYRMDGTYHNPFATTFSKTIEGMDAYYSVTSNSMYVSSAKFIGLSNSFLRYRKANKVLFTAPSDSITSDNYNGRLRLATSSWLVKIMFITRFSIPKAKKFDLEGEFGDLYDYYASRSRQTELLEIFTPNIMEQYMATRCSVYISVEGAAVIQAYIPLWRRFTQSKVKLLNEGIRRSEAALAILSKGVDQLLEVDDTDSRMILNEDNSNLL